MFLVCHFKVKMTTEVLKRVSIRDRWDRFVVYEKLRLILKRTCGKFLYSKCDAFIDTYDHVSPLAPASETIQ